MPKNNPPRERRLKPGEYELLQSKVLESRFWYLWPIINIAIETAMRRSEILALKWEHVDWQRKCTLLPITKNGRSRWVPLSLLAMDHLTEIPHSSSRIFPVSDVIFRQAWDRLRKRSNLDDLTFHDLRHEAISRMIEKGLNISELMAISGHRTANQLFRYVQITPRQFN